MGAGSMDGKRVLVTGAGTGIGREIALEFAREGAVVALHYAHSAEGAEEAVREIRDAGGNAVAFHADMRSIEEAKALAARALDFLGGLDILVNNAGITMNRPFTDITPEQFDTLFHVNVRGPFFLTQALLPALIDHRGAIVNLTSIHAFEGCTEHSVYAATKGAIVAYTRELAIELAPKGVRVNAIAPGAVPVENHFKCAPDKDRAEVLHEAGRCIPCGFAGTALDIARVAVFLASDAARYIVGQTLVVDGGTTSWLPFGEEFKHPMTVQYGQGYVPGL